ncbi:MAG: AraC family transcriptional regulator ligand-binding domain-containing protein [Hahellaceae bacterium]|nr:AraC family transcriptional regulator ligand-binding domain-containing protein [Hahellaceae bacterium]
MLNDFLITQDVIGFIRRYLKDENLQFPDYEVRLDAVLRSPSLSYAQWWTLLEDLHRLHPVPALGVAIGAAVRVEDCGVMGYLFQTARNLMEALACFQRFQRLIYAGSKAQVVLSEANEVTVTWNPEQGYSSQDSDALLLAGMMGVCRRISRNPDFRPLSVEFTQSVSPHECAAYEHFFGLNVRFGQARLAITLDKRELLKPIPQSDQFLHDLLGQQATALLDKMPDDDIFMAQLRNALLRCLHEGKPAAIYVAAEMNSSVRTLHRELARRGKVFRDVLRDVRMSMSQHYLADPSLTLSEIGLLLGYSEQSAFCRAFAAWFGSPPLRWRQQRWKS